MKFEYTSNEFYVRHAIDDCPNDRDFSMHIHDRCEIFFFISGKAEYLVEGSRYPLEPYHLLIMRAAESHKIKILDSSPYERIAINFTPSVIDHIDPVHRLMKPFNDRPLGRGNLYLPSEFEDKRFKDLLFEMCACREDEYGSRLCIFTHLLPLLDLISAAHVRRGFSEYMPPQDLSEQIMMYVNTHLFDKLSIPVLAKQFFLSTSQFHRIFRQAAGASPWEYINIKRLTAAREKICNGISSQQASESCGFGDYSAFYRSYTKYFGHSPQKDML